MGFQLGNHQWLKYHLSCKGNPKLADDQNLFGFLYAVVCAGDHCHSSGSGSW